MGADGRDGNGWEGWERMGGMGGMGMMEGDGEILEGMEGKRSEILSFLLQGAK